MGNETVAVLLGKTLTSVYRVGDEEIVFEAVGGERFRLYHSQDCCESVTIDDVCGDLSDLIGSPILKAEEVSSDDPAFSAARDPNDESFTWTFYHFATAKGYVAVRWYGESNGYYSESVDFGRF